MKEKTFISAVVYVYNSEKVIKEFIINLDKTLQQKFEVYEIILVNDCSEDNTRHIIESLNKKLTGNLTLLNLAWMHKKELAMLAGSDLAIGDFVFELESTKPDYAFTILFDIYEKALEGYDIVSAYPEGKTKKKSKLFYKLLNKLSHLDVDLVSETIKVISRKALNRALLERGRIRYRKAIYKYCGFPNIAISYKPINKKRADDEISFIEKVSLASDIFVIFSDIGTQIAMLFSLFALIMSLAIGLYAVVVYINFKSILSGWTTLMLFLSLGFSGVFLVLTVIAKYISTILQEQRKTSLYIVESIEKLG